MQNDVPACVYCGSTHEEVPLVRLLSKGQDFYICGQHLPILIHEPQKLVGKLPGVEKLRGHDH